MECITGKKVLVLSNNCFSLSNSNGRTLGNLFTGWPKENLAQFCISASDPDWEVCDNYYCLEDKNILKSFMKLQKAEGRRLDPRIVNNSANYTSSYIGRKTVSKVILRELVWANNRWNSKSFRDWVDDFNPDMVLLQFGDTIFMLHIAYTISKSRNIPLVIYNTEGYYFFSRNWHHATIWDNFIFNRYNAVYRRCVEKVMERAECCVYLNEKLKDDYDKAFAKWSIVIYNSSSVQGSEETLMDLDFPRMSYLGNLGLDRDSAIIEIGKVLKEINPSYKIDVYGKADADMEKRLNSADGVAYHGLVSYDKVKRVMTSSDILFHVETEKGYYEHQLQYAFTTKIADSLASGRCFIVYAPSDLACCEYIKKYECGWVASNKDELKQVIIKIITDADERMRVIKRAREISNMNHNLRANALKFQTTLLSLSNENFSNNTIL